MNSLHKRILAISADKKLSHLGSNLTAVNIIDEIYKNKESNDSFILSSGHAGLALYVVLEKYFNINAEMLLEKHGIHPCKDLKNRIECSTGSLGQGITVAVGKAIADKNRRVFVLCSDGEAAEGSYMESCKFLEENPSYSENIKIFVNYNGFGAYKTTDKKSLEEMFPRLIDRKVLNIIDTTEVMNYYSDTLKDLAAHYKVLTKKESEKYV